VWRAFFFVTVALFLMFESLIVHRITRLTQAMDSFPEDPPEDFLLPSVFRDELDSVSDNFVFFCDRLKKSQEELLQTKGQAHLSEKMASLGILSAGIAHEVNNPLGGMLNCVKSMRENPQDRELIERYLPLLDKGLRQIETTMRQLLNFGRTEPLKAREIDLRVLFSECTQLLSYKLKNIQLETNIAVSTDHRVDAEALSGGKHRIVLEAAPGSAASCSELCGAASYPASATAAISASTSVPAIATT